MPKQEAINYCYRHKEEFIEMYIDAEEGKRSFDFLIVNLEEGDLDPKDLWQRKMDF